MNEIWITSKSGLEDLEEIGLRIPKSNSKSTAALVFLDTENKTCSAGAITYLSITERNGSTFALKSNLDYDKIARVVKLEARRNGNR